MPNPGLEMTACSSRHAACIHASAHRVQIRFYLSCILGGICRIARWRRSALSIVATASMLALHPAIAADNDIGQVKVAKGRVTVERRGQTLPVEIGARLQTSDIVRTGDDGSVGITMNDNSLLSVGPNSMLSLDRFDYDGATQRGQFDSSLQKGSVVVISGRIAKQSPDAMTVKTPSAILGVRGTEFAVSVND